MIKKYKNSTNSTPVASPGAVPGKRPIIRFARRCSGFMLIALLTGCTIGPKVYESSFNDYNDAIRKTSDGQMLTNLVRMRYLESPIFLQVSSLNTSFSVGANAGVSATNVSGGPDSATANVGGSYSETPTITFSLPESRKYYGLLMAPLSSHQILQLIDGGWNSGEVLRSTLRGINGLKNSTIEYTTYLSAPDSYDEFNEALGLIEKLIMEGKAEFKAGGAFTLWSTPVGPVGNDPLAQAILAATTVYAKNAGTDLVENAEGKFEITHRV